MDRQPGISRDFIPSCLRTRATLLAGALLTGIMAHASAADAEKPLPGGNNEAVPSQREIVKHAMGQRPDDPWPRSWGHVLLAVPGSQQPEKGYHEPGGSFSPSVGSFGVSIWVTDSAGKLKTTSDTVPIQEMAQKFTWPEAKGMPAIVTTTPYYESRWSCESLKSTTLDLEPRGDAAGRLELVIRSIGPAGGPIQKIERKGKEIRINDRWNITIQPWPVVMAIGHEGDTGWKNNPAPNTKWEGEDGWGYVRMELAPGRCRLKIQDTAAHSPSPLHYPAVRATLKMELPDQRFMECLNAQVAHLMMGLLDRRTPPGEPTNYPLAWQRDGASVMAGLVRSGQLETTRELAKYFAEVDFFGGFGAEGDAPGQGLRVMEEVAVRLNDPAFDRWLWPHAQRKAALILKMAATTVPIHMPYVGPIVPEHCRRPDLDLVCEAAQDGRIVGRMDFGHRISYITGISYQGLRSAAALAERLHHPEEAQGWRAAAARLEEAWVRKPQWDEERTYMSGLWPTWAAAGCLDAYRTHLEQRSDPKQYLPWTYFSAAMTHQWLLLGEPDRVWKNVEWFLNLQTSPGLYTWWEGNREENTFNLWQNVRGWVKPPNVTPHYWTAGEMLALLVEMLAYVDESGDQPVLVVGGGVPGAWIGKPMRVRGLSTSVGMVDWNWQDGKMHVTVYGSKPKVRAGPAFGSAVPVEVSYRGR